VVVAAASTGSGSGFTSILFLLLLFGVVYFLMIRPQQKRRREALQMQSSLAPGDRIVTIGGLHGTVASVTDEVVHLDIAPGVQVQFARQAIARVLDSATEGAVAEVPAEDEPAAAEPAVEEPVQSPIIDTRKKD